MCVHVGFGGEVDFLMKIRVNELVMNISLVHGL